jgi:16S rRNA (adenine1518-N6/adenine1519-N6)-dimethyltransferase
MHRPSDLHALLAEIGAQPKKGMSQNFLIDGNILNKIVAAAEVIPGERVLEIGAGPGALTQKLLEAGAYVDAVELDLPFAQALHRLQTEDGRLKVHQGDIMKVNLDEIIHQGPIKVIANLPYRLTTPILTLLLPRHDLISSLTLMVQDEVAHRLTSKPGHPDYGFSTIFTAFWSDPSYLFRVSPHCFYPKPKVHSAMIRMKLRPPPFPVDNNIFLAMTQAAFHQRRKMLRNTLQDLFPDVNLEEVLSEVGVNPKARAEALTLEDFVRLYEKLH